MSNKPVEDIQDIFDEIDEAAQVEKPNQDKIMVEDVEEASEHIVLPEKDEDTPAVKLNYHCMNQLDDEENTANAFIDTKEMRSNEFLLQNFTNNVIPADADQSQNVIITRQKKLFQKQMQSLIVAFENKLRVKLSFEEETKEGVLDIFSKCLEIDQDSNLGPARVTSGNISDVQIDVLNNMFILSDNGIYLEVPLSQSENNVIKLEGSTVDLGFFEKMGLNKLAINSYDSEGPKVIYGQTSFLLFEIDELIQNRIAATQLKHSKQIENNYFVLDSDDNYNLVDMDKFFDNSKHVISNVKISQNDLIFVQNSNNEIVVLEVLSDENIDLIYRFSNAQYPVSDFHLLNTLDLVQEEQNERLKKLEDKLNKISQPDGISMITVNERIVALWKLNQKNEHSIQGCELMCQIVLAQGSEVISTQYMDGIILAQHSEKALFSVIKIGKVSPSQKRLQFTQLSLLSIPSQIGSSFDSFNFELYTKKLSGGRIQVNVRHLTQRNVIRDFITTVMEQRELYQGLIDQGAVKEPSQLEKNYANDPQAYMYSLFKKERKEPIQNDMLDDLLQNFQRKIERDDETLLQEVESFNQPKEEQDISSISKNITTDDIDKFMQNTFSGFRGEPQSERETEQFMKLFNEQDVSDQIDKKFEAKIREDARKRLISDDIFKEIDEQVFAERPKVLEEKRVEIIEDDLEQSDQEDKNDESPDKSSSPDRYDEEEDIDDEGAQLDVGSQESMEGLNIDDYSDKHLQKLQKLSAQQLDRVKQITKGVDVCTSGYKKLNKGFKQQTLNVSQKVTTSLKKDINSSLVKSTNKLRTNTILKVQSHYDNQLDENLDNMFARLQTKMVSLQNTKIAEQKTNELDWISSASKSCFRDELVPVITQSISQALQTHVTIPYQCAAKDYLQQQAESDKIIHSYLNRYEKEVMQEQLGLEITKNAVQTN